MKLQEIITQLAESYLESGGAPNGLHRFLSDSVDVTIKVKQKRIGDRLEFKISFDEDTITVIKTIDNETGDTQDPD